jgi:lipoyl(octanoyl) transferase
MEYLDALELQRSLHNEIADNQRENTLLLVEHPSVYTAGKRTQDHERPSDGTPVIDVDRGGKITWHGLGQLVGYPIVRLAKPTELVGFVREIESALIVTCSELGLAATRVEGRSGVWVVDNKGERKIAAIGIRVARGVTMHGFALNVEPDLTPFQAIIPCGIEDAAVTSLAIELGRSISLEEVLPIVEKHMYESLAKVSR